MKTIKSRKYEGTFHSSITFLDITPKHSQQRTEN